MIIVTGKIDAIKQLSMLARPYRASNPSERDCKELVEAIMELGVQDAIDNNRLIVSVKPRLMY